MTSTQAAPLTEPEQFDLKKVRTELAAVTGLLTQLALYREREFRELPDQLRAKVRALKSIVQPTASGLEHVESLLWQLGTVKELLETLNSGQSIRLKIDNLTKPATELSLFGASALTSVAAPQPAVTPVQAPAAPAPTGATLTLGPDEPPATPTATSPAEPTSITPAPAGNEATLTLTTDDVPSSPVGTLVLPNDLR